MDARGRLNNESAASFLAKRKISKAGKKKRRPERFSRTGRRQAGIERGSRLTAGAGWRGGAGKAMLAYASSSSQEVSSRSAATLPSGSFSMTTASAASSLPNHMRPRAPTLLESMST